MTFNYKAKKTNIANANSYMLAKTLSMFEWEGLPESVPAKELELILQKSGLAFLAEHEGKIYALTGTLGGECDAYGNPKQFIVSNPWLKLNKTFDVEKDGVLVRNDDLSMGMMPIFDKYNYMLTENEVSMVVYGFNTRLSRLISASDDSTKADAQRALNKIVDGELSVIGESIVFDGMKVHASASDSGQSLKTMIEYQQYLRATLNNEIGISANSNLKRERLIGAEVEQNEEGLFTFVYTMAKCRQEAVTKINKFFGTTVKVGFGSVWKDRQLSKVDGKVESANQTDIAPAGVAPAIETETVQIVEPENPQAPTPDPKPERNQEQEQGQEQEQEPEPGQEQEQEQEQEQPPAPDADPATTPATNPELVILDEMLQEQGISDEEIQLIEQLKIEVQARVDNEVKE